MPSYLDFVDFTFSPEEFSEHLATWHKEGWPVQLLLRDHFSAKLLEDNGVFNSIRFYKHEWKWDDEDGFLMLQKQSGQTETTWAKWEEILPNLEVRNNKKGEFKFDGATYGAEGLEYEFSFQFSPSEFKEQLTKWTEEGWPISFLLRDHYGAKVLFDNQVFPLMEFYNHETRWDEEHGLYLMFKDTPTSKARWVPWNEIASKVPVVRTPQGWLLFDGWNYTQEGLVPHHLWQWRKLKNSYMFPAGAAKPNYCYLDIISFCWEHEGMQGFGIRTPHGHLALEFGDHEGNFYSVGQYMDPRSQINTKHALAATVRAVLMSPDPYMPSKGEKTVHRYLLGHGKEGKDNVIKLKKHIESIQSWEKNPETGVIHTCRKRKYQLINNNCGDFCREIEQYAIQDLNAKLIKIDADAVLVPGRRRVLTKSSWVADMTTNLWNRFLLFLMDCILFFAISTPWVSSKIGAGTEDDLLKDPYYGSDPKSKKRTRKAPEMPNSMMAMKKVSTLLRSFKPKPVNFPARMRVEQLYSPRLKDFSAKLKS